MSDDDGDLDEFARMFGAKPETPPEGLIPVAPAQPTPPAGASPSAAPPAPSDPLSWLITPTPPADVPIVAAPDAAEPFPPAADLPTAVLPAPGPTEPIVAAADAPTTAFPAPPPSPFLPDEPATTVFPGASEAGAAATLAAFPPAPAVLPPAADPFSPAIAAFPPAPAEAPTTVFPTRRSVQSDLTASGGFDGGDPETPDNSRRNLILLGVAGGVLLILIIVLVFVLIGKFSNAPAVATPTDILPSSASPSPATSATPSPTPTPTTDSPTPTPTTTPTPTPTQSTAPPPPAATISNVAVVMQPSCPTAGTTGATFTASYTVKNTSLIRVSNPDGSVVANITPDPSGSGTTPAIPYNCSTSTNFTFTAIGSGQQASSSPVTPVPTTG